jgi:hypothetical protein
MRFAVTLLVTMFLAPVCGAADFSVWTDPPKLQVSVSSTKVVRDGIEETVKGPYVPLKLRLKSYTGSPPVTLTTVDVVVTVPGVSTDRHSFPLSPYVTLQPGQSTNTDTFYVPSLRNSWGSDYRLRISVNGWRGAGNEADDRVFATVNAVVPSP